MYQDTAQLAADQRELFILIRRAIVHIKLLRDAVSGHGIMKHFLEVSAVVLIEKSSADNQPGTVIQEHDAVGAP